MYSLVIGEFYHILFIVARVDYHLMASYLGTLITHWKKRLQRTLEHVERSTMLLMGKLTIFDWAIFKLSIPSQIPSGNFAWLLKLAMEIVD